VIVRLLPHLAFCSTWLEPTSRVGRAKAKKREGKKKQKKKKKKKKKKDDTILSLEKKVSMIPVPQFTRTLSLMQLL
jgi:hypothetical protein